MEGEGTGRGGEDTYKRMPRTVAGLQVRPLSARKTIRCFVPRIVVMLIRCHVCHA